MTTLAKVRKNGINDMDISVRYLRAGGAIGLICGKIDQHNIHMFGRCPSDAVLR
jgi:hypothetical protein